MFLQGNLGRGNYMGRVVIGGGMGVVWRMFMIVGCGLGMGGRGVRTRWKK